MKFRRDKSSLDNEATAENPVALPKIETTLLPTETATFVEAAKEVMTTHAATFEALAKHDTTSNFSEKAFGVFKDKKTGMWNVVEITYDCETLAVNSKLTLIPAGDTDKSAGLERFQIVVAQKLIHEILYK